MTQDESVRIRGLGVVLCALLLTCVGSTRARGDDEAAPEVPKEVPVAVAVDVDAADTADTGIWKLALSFEPLEDVTRAYRVELRLIRFGRELLVLDHGPTPPTTQWKKGRPVRYELPAPVPLQTDVAPGEPMELYLGFYDIEADKVVPPRTEGRTRASRQLVGELLQPALEPIVEPAQVEGLIEKARALATAGRKPDAWRTLELGLRRAVEDAPKYRFRDALLGLGNFDPEPISPLEREIVAKRIADERERHLRQMSGRFFDRGKLFAALRILEAIGGSLAEQADSAVIGALDDAKRTERDIIDLKVRILGVLSDEDKEKARKAVESLGPTKRLYDKAEEWAEERAWGRARYALRELSLSSDRELASQARERIERLDEQWLADTPPEEEMLVKEALENPAFGRITTVPSHRFLFIGPKTLVEGIPAQSKLNYDLAYVFQTDLFGRVPNPGGDRVTVFLKELWDFGGGVGGGKTIDIGKADPDRVGYRVDTGLLYHELTHCVDDTNPIFEGFREGLANMGAAYTFEALGEKGDELHAFKSNLKAFEEDYLARDLEYWRIQNYGPSAGFFLHFEEEHAKTPTGHDWKPMRRFFREYRNAPVHDGREPYIARVMAYYLIRAFGPGAFDDLLKFRWPLVESDREAVGLEVEAFAKGDHRVKLFLDDLRHFPNTPLVRDLITQRMLETMRRRGSEDEVRRISKEELGIVHDWWVIGPFRAKGTDPRACVFPPEREIDLAAEYPTDANVCKWRRPGETSMVGIDPRGWISILFSYQENTADYALTHVVVDEDTEAFVHVRADDDFALFLNDRRVDDYINRGVNASDLFWWRGPYERVPDGMRLPVTLQKGRNKVLLKIKNRQGEAGFVLAFSRRDGQPISGLRVEPDPPPPAGDTVSRPRKTIWKNEAKFNFRARTGLSHLETAVGELKIVNKVMQGAATDGRVAWRKYTVRPGFPKDSPSNLFWLKERDTKGVDAFRLSLGLVPRNEGVPKLVVTFQGDGGKDGLSGWNLIVHPAGKDQVAARLERYDELYYQTPPLPAPGGEVQPLVLVYQDERLTVTLGELVLFDEISIRPIHGRNRIGISTYGPALGFESIELETPSR